MVGSNGRGNTIALPIQLLRSTMRRPSGSPEATKTFKEKGGEIDEFFD